MAERFLESAEIDKKQIESVIREQTIKGIQPLLDVVVTYPSSPIDSRRYHKATPLA